MIGQFRLQLLELRRELRRRVIDCPPAIALLGDAPECRRDMPGADDRRVGPLDRLRVGAAGEQVASASTSIMQTYMKTP